MSVLAVISSVTSFVDVRRLLNKDVVIDNLLFRAHYCVTTALFFVCCILLTANNFIGEPISCIGDGSIPNHALDAFCWISATFTIPGRSSGDDVDATETPHLGLGPVESGDEKVYHSYYQWVPFMLCLQGVFFYFPHWLWKSLEGGKIRMILDGIRGVGCPDDESVPDSFDRRQRVADFIVQTRHDHKRYAYAYFFCEFLNLVNVFLNMHAMDWFLGGTFMTYGTRVLEFADTNQENRTDPMIEIFPRVTKCTFHRYGVSGSVQVHDALCILALNVLNEKIYIFLWFWLIILALLSTYALLRSVVVVCVKPIREIVLARHFRFGPPNYLTRLAKETRAGDFLLLEFLGQNLNAVSFGELLANLDYRLNVFLEVPGNRPTASSSSTPSVMELLEYPTKKLMNMKQ